MKKYSRAVLPMMPLFFWQERRRPWGSFYLSQESVSRRGGKRGEYAGQRECSAGRRSENMKWIHRERHYDIVSKIIWMIF